MKEQAVKQIIKNQLGIKDVTDSDDIRTDLGADSLDFIELILEIEEEFNIIIPDEDADRIKTVGDMIAYVEAHIK